MRLRRRRESSPEAAAWAAHEARAGSLVADLQLSGRPQTSEDRVRGWLDGIYAAPPDVAGSALLLLVRTATRQQLPWALIWKAAELTRRRWSVTRADAFLAARTVCDAPDNGQAAWSLKITAALLQRALADGSTPTDDELETLRLLLRSIDGRQGLYGEEHRDLRNRVLRLLPAPGSAAVGLSVIEGSDGWAAAVIPELRRIREAEKPNALLRHLTMASGSKPSAKWLAVASELAEDESAAGVVRLLVARLETAKPVTRKVSYYGDLPVVLGDQNVDVARAAVWAAIPISQPWVVPTLLKVGVRGMSSSGLVGWMSGEKVPNACILALGRIATPEAVAALQHLADVTKHNGFRTRIANALQIAAEASGLTPSQLVERTVPTGGLDRDGAVTVTAGSVVAQATIDDQLKITTRWQTGNGWTAKAPAGAPSTDLSQAKRSIRDLKQLLGGDRRRVEGLLATDRSWDLDEWRRYYLDHPLTGRIARRLLWVVEINDVRLVGIPTGSDTLCTLAGEKDIPPRGVVRLWHPAMAPTDEVAAWRAWLLDEGMVQPVKQAFREVYLLTGAERETGTYSNRFAAHILRYQQLYALFKERAWVSNYLGSYDGGYEGKARHEFLDAGLTVVFEHFQVDPDAGAYQVDLCSTDRVWFFRTADRAKQPLALEDVPPLVFSEAMRDVDLFVGVTSIALDPNWADRGDDPYYDYWLAASFGDLAATAQVRRDVLSTLLPKLKVADRVELGDRYVRVRGNRATYKVHLGSANILIEPDDRYLCIVAASDGRTKKIMLPFEGDEVLTVVLSKVLMLADDDKITDPTILSQLGGRGR